jgi:hypothetical protein
LRYSTQRAYFEKKARMTCRWVFKNNEWDYHCVGLRRVPTSRRVPTQPPLSIVDNAISVNNKLQNTDNTSEIPFNIPSNLCFSDLKKAGMANYYCHLFGRKNGPVDSYYSTGITNDGCKNNRYKPKCAKTSSMPVVKNKNPIKMKYSSECYLSKDINTIGADKFCTSEYGPAFLNLGFTSCGNGKFRYICGNVENKEMLPSTRTIIPIEVVEKFTKHQSNKTVIPEQQKTDVMKFAKHQPKNVQRNKSLETCFKECVNNNNCEGIAFNPNQNNWSCSKKGTGVTL